MIVEVLERERERERGSGDVVLVDVFKVGEEGRGSFVSRACQVKCDEAVTLGGRGLE